MDVAQQTSTRLENLAVYQLAMIANRSSQYITKLFDETLNLQLTDWRVIALLMDVEYLPFKEVVERTGMDKSRISRAHVRLQKVGLIQVAEGPFDKRTLVMKLTPKGIDCLNAILPKANEFDAWLLNELEEQELELLEKILTQLKTKVKEIEI